MSFPQAACKDRLVRGLDQSEISLSEAQIEQLISYLSIFHQWNKAYNLSAIREPYEMVDRHLLDSLVIVPFMQSHLAELSEESTLTRQLADVGTGGGLPGIPLAIVFPELSVTLVDSNGKKTRFLFQTSVQLGLKNTNVENNRVEKFSPEDKFDIVTSRAYASLQDMAQSCRHLLKSEGEFWAMKGQFPDQELAECEDSIELVNSHPLVVPGLEGERHLLILKPKC
jgi:16S rRNA (guanine527-N7)-methyltransferase